MKLTHEEQDEISVFHLRGDMTAESCDMFRTNALSCMEKQVRDFVLDCGQLESIDSAGLETWIWLQETCAEKLGQVHLSALSEELQKVLEITRLKLRFHTHPNTEQALASLN